MSGTEQPARTREELTEKIRHRKMVDGLTWKGLAASMGSGISPVYATAALLGEMRLTKAEAEAVAGPLKLHPEEVLLLQQIPYRGQSSPMPPTDPLIYRFYEIVLKYGTTWKALMEEEFGDGIMSAIDFEMSMERKPDPKGDRVNIILSGKHLSYRRY